MHRLLKRQVKQVFGKDFDIANLDMKTLKLFDNITETYENFDKEKLFLNHTIKENKRDLRDIYNSMILRSRLAGIGEMMENIAHQWKQPLSIILNIISILKLDLKENKELEIIEDQTKYLDKTIADFQNFSSHSDDEKKSFELEKSINESLKLFNYQATMHKISINKTLEKGLMQRGDMGKFNQALLVIFANAKDAFSDKDEIGRVINIESKTINGEVLVTIQDNAGGISKEVINKIFEPYFTTKFKDKGTGIGLSMTYSIIQKMNGQIKVENCNDGALFSIRLPQYMEQKDIEWII